jgi:hypothetical protein
VGRVLESRLVDTYSGRVMSGVIVVSQSIIILVEWCCGGIVVVVQQRSRLAQW